MARFNKGEQFLCAKHVTNVLNVFYFELNFFVLGVQRRHEQPLEKEKVLSFENGLIYLTYIPSTY